MAEPNETEVSESPAPAKDKQPAAKGPGGFMVTAAVVVVVAIGSGVGCGMFLGGKGSGASSQAASQPAGGEQSEDDGEYSYYELEQVTVNLDEPRLARLMRVVVVAAIKKGEFKAASELLDKKKPILKSWLTVYLSGCTLDDIRGPKNLNRIRREIETNINSQLWPNGRGLVAKVLFKEFGVQ